MEKKRSSGNVLAHAIGELELRIMELMWRYKAVDAKSVCAFLYSDEIKLSTAQTTLERLYKKKLVSREKDGRAYIYTPTLTRAELMAKLVANVISTLHDGSTDSILSSFVSIAENMNTESLDRLEQLVASRKKRLQEKDDV